jgi:hypothetical protein
MDKNPVEVKYTIAYQATNLSRNDNEGVVSVTETEEPPGSESNRHLKTFIDFKTQKMYNAEGKSGFVWAHIIIIYPKTNLIQQLRSEESDPDREIDVVLLYYWDKIYNTWVKAEKTQKAGGNYLDKTAVEANVTHFTVIAPMVNDEVEGYYRDPSIDDIDITFSVNAILGGGEDRFIEITAKIRNLGKLPIDELVVKFKDGPAIIGETTVTDIPGKGSKDATIVWKVKKNIDVGWHTIKVELDPNKEITDNDKKNDIARNKIMVVTSTDVVSSYYPTIATICSAVFAVVVLSSVLKTKKFKKKT